MSETGNWNAVHIDGAGLSRGRDAMIVAAVVGVVLLVPALIYGYLSYRQFDFFRLTYYVPYEEFLAAFRAFDIGAILAAPIVSANMTSGFLLANMYAVTTQQLLLSVGLGTAMGLNLVIYLALRRACPMRGATAATAGAGSGLAATIAASSTGILGCCGSALGGGLLALAGVGSTTAAQIAQVSPLIQLAMIAVFGISYIYLHRKLRHATTTTPVNGADERSK